MAHKGLEFYCQTVRKIVVGALEKNALTLSSLPPNAVVRYTTTTAQILDRMTLALQKHMPIIQSHWCRGAHLALLQHLQSEVDRQLTPLIRRFVIERRVLVLASQIKAVMNVNTKQTQHKGRKT